MGQDWTFGRKIGAGFATLVALALVIAVVAVIGLRGVVASKDKVIDTYAADLAGAERVGLVAEKQVSAARGYLIGQEQRFEESIQRARREFVDAVAQMERRSEGRGKDLLERLKVTAKDYETVIDQVIALRKTSAAFDAIKGQFESSVLVKRDALDLALREFIGYAETSLQHAREKASREASSAITLVSIIAIGAALAALLLAFLLTRTLGRQVGNAVGQVQSSSAELQAAANQQASGAKEQATAMNEISTTISELLATSRQIAESAQRVVGIAEDTGSSTTTGQDTVVRTQEAIGGIRRQVDQIVNHMLELGKKSQQIGSVLDIVSELAEQTNILAINATIEAAGAGEGGKRFSVVAEEIRKLADRVAGSTKEIRTLIDDVRAAVNTTVMATESGSKAVEGGAQHFGEVKASFGRIAELISATMEAAREIELSTKQQATAVEQVNVAISNVAQATKETETSSTQTLQTASQLSTLSRELLRLIQPEAAA